jgi:hypothetical protein
MLKLIHSDNLEYKKLTKAALNGLVLGLSFVE